jgi:hypothetical protein
MKKKIFTYKNFFRKTFSLSGGKRRASFQKQKILLITPFFNSDVKEPVF